MSTRWLSRPMKFCLEMFPNICWRDFEVMKWDANYNFQFFFFSFVERLVTKSIKFPFKRLGMHVCPHVLKFAFPIFG